MPGLLRGMARTAVVVGTATATSNAVNRQQANRFAKRELVNTQMAPPPPPSPNEDVITKLERLGTLKAQGLLTEEEFSVQKSKLLKMT